MLTVDPGGSINSQLRNFAGIASECVDPGDQSTVNLGTLQGLPLSVLIWGGSIDSQLSNFAGIASECVDSRGLNQQST